MSHASVSNVLAMFCVPKKKLQPLLPQPYVSIDSDLFFLCQHEQKQQDLNLFRKLCCASTTLITTLKMLPHSALLNGCLMIEMSNKTPNG
jgi:hypothetical protein